MLDGTNQVSLKASMLPLLADNLARYSNKYQVIEYPDLQKFTHHMYF